MKPLYQHGQGSLDYLLLIGGAVLMVTVILLLLFYSVIPAIQTILQNNLSQFPGGNGLSTNQTPAAFGPITVDWGTLPEITTDDYRGSLAHSLAGFTITNTDSTQPISLDSIRINFSMVELPTLTMDDFKIERVQLSNGASWNASGSPAVSGQPIPLSFTLNPGETIQGTIEFDTMVNLLAGGTDTFSIYARFDDPNYLPVHTHQTLQIEFHDTTSAAAPLMARSSALHHNLSLESNQGVSCDGLGLSVGPLPSFSTITDALDGGEHSRDLGYSTSFYFDPIPANAIVHSTSLFVFQEGDVSFPPGTAAHSDPIYFLKDSSTGACQGINNTIDNGLALANNITVFSQNPIPAGPLAELKYFTLNGMVIPSTNDVHFTIRGNDYDYPAALGGGGGPPGFTGHRVWSSSNNPAAQPPVLITRYSTP